MKIRLGSKAATRKWASILSLAFVVLITLKTRNANGAANVSTIPLPTFAIAGLGIAGFLMGIISALRDKDRSLLTLLSISIGLLIIFWIVAEVAYPH